MQRLLTVFVISFGLYSASASALEVILNVQNVVCNAVSGETSLSCTFRDQKRVWSIGTSQNGLLTHFTHTPFSKSFIIRQTD